MGLRRFPAAFGRAARRRCRPGQRSRIGGGRPDFAIPAVSLSFGGIPRYAFCAGGRRCGEAVPARLSGPAAGVETKS